jgi:hypothetical protein
MYLQVFTDSGVMGLLGFVTLLTASLMMLAKLICYSEKAKLVNFSKAVLLSIIAYMIQGLTNDNHLVIQPILYLLIATGIATCKELSKVEL